jgi:hypothetical protein
VRMETGATAFECNPWVMRAAMNAVRKVFPDATMIKVYRPNEGLVAVLEIGDDIAK